MSGMKQFTTEESSDYELHLSEVKISQATTPINFESRSN